MPFSYRKPKHKIPEIPAHFITRHKNLGHSDEYIKARWEYLHRRIKHRLNIKIKD